MSAAETPATTEAVRTRRIRVAPPHDPTLPWWAQTSPRPYLTPAQVRTHTLPGTLRTFTLLLVAALGVYWVLTGTGVKDVTVTNTGALAYKQTTNALIGGCGAMYSFPSSTVNKVSGLIPDHNAVGHANRQSYTAYNTVVPMFGPFWHTAVNTQRQRFWGPKSATPPLPENLLNNEWHGAMVVYYTNTTPTADVQTLHRMAAEHPEMNLIVVPWDAAIGPMPQNRSIAFTTWDASQSCHQLVAPALYDFRRLHPASQAPGATGAVPPVRRATAPIAVSAQ